MIKKTIIGGFDKTWYEALKSGGQRNWDTKMATTIIDEALQQIAKEYNFYGINTTYISDPNATFTKNETHYPIENRFTDMKDKDIGGIYQGSYIDYNSLWFQNTHSRSRPEALKQLMRHELAHHYMNHPSIYQTIFGWTDYEPYNSKLKYHLLELQNETNKIIESIAEFDKPTIDISIDTKQTVMSYNYERDYDQLLNSSYYTEYSPMDKVVLKHIGYLIREIEKMSQVTDENGNKCYIDYERITQNNINEEINPSYIIAPIVGTILLALSAMAIRRKILQNRAQELSINHRRNAISRHREDINNLNSANNAVIVNIPSNNN